MKMISKKLGLRLAALTAATVGLSGCVYDVGLGYASDGYGYNDYNCDPYSQFDSYYDCDNSYGFYNIGFGGGWYDSFWYPGHGYYVFDNYGRRFNMRDHHRRYWGDRRHRWYRENRGHDNRRGHDGNYGRGRDHDDRHRDGRRDGRRHDRGHGNGQNGNSAGVDQPIAWPENNGGRRSEHPGRRRDGNAGPGAVSNSDGDWGRRGNDRDDRRGGRGDGRQGRNNGQSSNDGNGNAIGQPDPQIMARPGPDRREDRGGRGDGGGRDRAQQPSNGAPQNAGAPQQREPQQPAARQRPEPQQPSAPEPRADRPTMREGPDRVPD